MLCARTFSIWMRHLCLLFFFFIIHPDSIVMIRYDCIAYDIEQAYNIPQGRLRPQFHAFFSVLIWKTNSKTVSRGCCLGLITVGNQ
jgi:hypothetical protein